MKCLIAYIGCTLEVPGVMPEEEYSTAVFRPQKFYRNSVFPPATGAGLSANAASFTEIV
jgi:hypothetical protein